MATDYSMNPQVAVVGCGYWGKNLVRNFYELDALGAVCDGNAETAQEFAAQYNIAEMSFDSVLEASDIDGIVIASPAETHAPLVERCLQAGKHVFVEKPIALQVDDAIKLVTLADEFSRVLMVGHLLQYHPAFLKLKEMISEGDLGRLRHIYSHRLNLGKIRREENILWSFAPHDISMILSLVGSEPDVVSAIGNCYLHRSNVDVTTTHLSFPGGENAHIFVSWLHPYKEQKLVVVGDESMAVFDDTQAWEGKLLLYPHRLQWKDGMPIPDKADEQIVPIEPLEPLRQEASHFLECIKGQTTCRTDGAEAIRVLKVLQASEQAMVDKASVSLSASGGLDSAQKITYFAHETTCIDEGAEIGEGTRIWHYSHVLPGCRIGRHCTLGQNVMLGPDVTIGDNCKIQNNVSLYKGITLEDGVFCGPSCVFTNVNTPRAEIERKDEFSPIVVRRGATIGANATIVCGVELGAYCFIGAGAVVTKDVSPFALMAGTPARQIGWVGHAGERLGEDLTCPRTGRRYKVNGDQQLEELISN